MGGSDEATTIAIFASVAAGAVICAYYWWSIVSYTQQDAGSEHEPNESDSLNSTAKPQDCNAKEAADQIFTMMGLVVRGCNLFLKKCFGIQILFILAATVVIFAFVGLKGQVDYNPTYKHHAYSENWALGAFTTVAFLVGSLTSMICARIGCGITCAANGRVTMKCLHSEPKKIYTAFVMAMKGSMAMSYALITLAIANLFFLMLIYKLNFKTCNAYNKCELEDMYKALTAYALGASSMAIFGRLGGGIYTKAMDVGVELCGKLEYGLPADDPKNPAAIADLVGDDVGLIAGIGSDLFGSFAEGTCAAMVILGSANNTVYWRDGAMYPVVDKWASMCFPLSIFATGLVVCFLISLVTTHVGNSDMETQDVEHALKRQLVLSTICMTPLMFLLGSQLLPSEFYVQASIGIRDTAPKTKSANAASCESQVWDPTKRQSIGYPVNMSLADFNGPLCMGALNSTMQHVNWYDLVICVVVGLWAGLFIGFVTEYYTSDHYTPVQDVARASEFGPATNVIYGLALGYNSSIIPVIILCSTVFVGYGLAKMLGVACAACGMMCIFGATAATNAFAPIVDNAFCLAEMSLGKVTKDVVEKTKGMDNAGDQITAIGKGFAIGSAAMAALAGFCGYCVRCDIKLKDVSILEPNCFVGLLFGAMLPYAVCAFTMKSVGEVAQNIKKQMEKKFQTPTGRTVVNGEWDPVFPDEPSRAKQDEWYGGTIEDAANDALAEIGWPAVIAFGTPVLVGTLMGKHTLAGLCVGTIISGIQVALSTTNSGAAWDNAKKKLELEGLSGSSPHHAAIQGDTIGDPLRDASGPATNILMKLMPLVALTFAPIFASIRHGYGFIGCSLTVECTA